MLRTKSRLALCLCMICVNLAFIWGNSLLTGETSGEISGQVQEILEPLLAEVTDEPETAHSLVRKTAHFIEFGTLGMLLSWLFAMLQKKPWQRLVFPLLCGVAAACVDETIQCFVPDRGPGLKDVGIDTLGVILGIVIIYFIRKRKNSKYLEEQTL